MKSTLTIILGLACLVGGLNAKEPFDYHSVRGKQAVAADVTGKQEGESLPLNGKSRVQGMRNFGPHWSGDDHLLWDGTVGQVMETDFQVPKDGRHRLTAVLTLAPDYGIFTVRLKGKMIREGVDLYARGVELARPLDLGEFDLKAGTQQLSFKLTGGNPQARKFRGIGYLMGIDYLVVKNLESKEEAPDKPQKEVIVAEKAATLKDVQPLLAKYCYQCHGDKPKVKGKVNLKILATRSDFLKSVKMSRLGAEAVSYGEMPPEDETQPSPAERKKIAAFLYGVVDEYAKANTSLEPVVMRRFNRYEYNNAVRDLLQLRGDIYALPEKVVRGNKYFNPASGVLPNKVRVSNRTLGKNQMEQQILKDVDPFAIDLQAEHGFNNQGEQLSTSTILLESLLKLGRAIVNSPQFDGYTGLRNTFFKEDGKPVKEKLDLFLQRAFRAPVSEATLERYASYHEKEKERTKSYTQAMKNVVAAVLASPKFLYVVENKRNIGERTPANDYELAQRLALFLWSSIPDEELLSAAKRGELRDIDDLEKQVRRMLLDPRSRALSENFARQWLRLDQLVTAVPDFDRFEEYYSRIGCEQWKFGLQTMVEPLLLFESIQVEDRSIMLLIDSNYAYRSNELQAWYTNPQKPFGNKGNSNRFNTNAQEFSRRVLNTRREGGIITTAAVLTMTSTPLRTSPIKRGAWVATVVFNDPPPPPPDVVPEIEEDDAAIAASGLTIRQRLKEHASNQSCASCHAKIDPLGFVLESYDPVGRWRDKYVGGLPVDASGKLFGEDEFKNILEFKDAILARPEEFMRGFSEHLLSYALGRELKVTDKPAVDRITRKVMEDHGRFSTVVVEIAKSLPFQNKTNQKERK
ncbi:MAG: DUF1592 domain-containing protein [Verrucomicrobia bacterium]|nr:DUF1592 domain-containing protein [Verrucomicrobiota bacterium]